MKALLSQSVFFLYRALPPTLRYRLKTLARTNGHTPSALDKLKAMRDADGKKRLDRAFEAVVSSLHVAGLSSLEGLDCLEVGAGFVPSDTLCFYLLGARTACAIDYNPIAQFDALHRAVATADIATLELALPQTMERKTFRARLVRLQEACAEGEAGLRRLGITYQAPLDLSVAPPARTYDFIYSVSVFEHIPAPQIPPILDNLTAALTPRGHMLNDIHLEDHFDMSGAPFEFLRKDTRYSLKIDIDARGNRIRLGGWRALFAHATRSRTRFIATQIRRDGRPAPHEMLEEFASLDPDDCFTSRLLALTTLQPAPPKDGTAA